MNQRRHMRDPSFATQEEQDAFSNHWGIYANEHLRNAAKPPNPNHEAADEVRWGDARTVKFDFTANGSQAVDFEQIIQVLRPARAWVLHLALTMVTPIQMPGGDNVACFYIVTAGVGASTIRFRRFLDNTNFVPCPLPGGLVQDVAELVVSDIAAKQLIVGARIQYNNSHGATSVQARIDAAASPVFR